MKTSTTSLSRLSAAALFAMAISLALAGCSTPSQGERFSSSPLAPPPTDAELVRTLPPAQDTPTLSPPTGIPTIPPPPGWPTDVAWPPPTERPQPTPTRPPSMAPVGLPPDDQQQLYYVADNQGIPELHVVGMDAQHEKASEFSVADESILGGMNLTGLYPSPNGEYLALMMASPMGGYAEVKMMERASGRTWCPLPNAPMDCWGGFSGWLSDEEFLFQPFDVPPEGAVTMGIIVVNLTTGHYHSLDLPLSSDGSYSIARNLSPSPDGSRIAYSITYFEKGKEISEIWVMSIKTEEKQLIQKMEGIVSGLSWSPTDNRLAYFYRPGTLTASSDASELWLIHVDGSHRTILADRIHHASDGLYGPKWSPDGRYIAFVQVDEPAVYFNSDERFRSNVYVANVSTGQIKRLSTFEERHTYYPTWSPDSTFVVFTSTGMLDENERLSALWISNIDTGQIYAVSKTIKEYNATVWLPSLEVR